MADDETQQLGNKILIAACVASVKRSVKTAADLQISLPRSKNSDCSSDLQLITKEVTHVNVPHRGTREVRGFLNLQQLVHYF